MSNPEIPQEPLPGPEPIAAEPSPSAPPAPAGATESVPAEAIVDTLPSPEEQLRQLELKVAEHHDAWLRAKAEGENIRRRAQDDITKAHKFAVEKFAGELLAVKDSLEAALAVPEQTVENFRSGVEITLKQLVSAFDKNALVEINPVGEKFDPHKHQAIGMVDSEQEANTVVTVLQKGYLIAERTLRPALVMVAKPKS
ncbi:MAG: nucleotide exchange factor GrpE [Azonexus sp.]|jgi:molecular chaperone GrpE|nr:nucleotide exchange factor GrpE [Betaproteobacteria bacterium]MBK8917399.1 nucleotide exchange factor GrpE [Betaproteobacteria bacterium]MBP6035949.1 nucleotide exchange factor GrpE [Azonexus sp.]MBP6906471.1 nucleotide exchange factor GrpE [Azonexus sp.]